MSRGIVKVLISVRDGLEALICCLCRVNTSSTHQADDVTGGDLIQNPSSSLPHTQVRSDDPNPNPNVTVVNNEAHSSSPPPLPPKDRGINPNKVHSSGGVRSSPPTPSLIHSSSPSPPAEARGGGLIENHSSSPPCTQIRIDDPNTNPDVTTVNNGPRSLPPPPLPPKHGNNNPNIIKVHPPGGVASPSPIHSPSPSPHVEAHEDGLIKNEPINKPTFTSLSGNLVANTGANIFPGAHNFNITDSNFIAFSVQDESNIAIHGMQALSACGIDAAHDSSVRARSSQCHPGTRVQLLEKIIAWFRNNKREKAILWLNGPAGVGKSAVFQTVAESLAASGSIGATLFFSRLNNRNDSQRVFTAVAYQLATQIPDYQTYITKRIALDPNLLKKGINDQFRIFISEPFGKKRMGMGKGSWAVLLDGLDECEGVDEQCRIVKLVSEFVLDFPGAPLVWVIASRPEPHIRDTFKDEGVASSSWSEEILVNSTEACQDVRKYLDAHFEDMRKRFSLVPAGWPGKAQVLKLTDGALGLFVFASTAVAFMEDPDYANPVSRLNLILSVIDRLDIKVIDNHPFALLDALYTQILTPIPLSVWSTTKRILGFVICSRSGSTEDGLSYPLHSSNRTLMKSSIVLGLKPIDTYGSLHKLHSVLGIPNSENASNSEITFLHASFGDYLTDQARSKVFYIDRGESVDDITRCLFQLYIDKPWKTGWAEYKSQLPAIRGLNFYKLRKDAEHSLHHYLTGDLRSKRGREILKSPQDLRERLDALSRLNPVELYHTPGARNVIGFLNDFWKSSRKEMENTGLFREVLLRDLTIGHLDYGSSRPSFFSRGPKSKMLVRSSHSLQEYTNKLQGYQELQPEIPVIIYGSLPKARVAFFEGTYGDSSGYFCFQYPY